MGVITLTYFIFCFTVDCYRSGIQNAPELTAIASIKLKM